MKEIWISLCRKRPFEFFKRDHQCPIFGGKINLSLFPLNYIIHTILYPQVF